MLQKLQQIGLSEKESQIYLELLKVGESVANRLAKQTSSNRTVTYNVLQQLVEKGLVVYVIKGNKRVYQAAKPESLLSEIREKESIANDLIKEIGKIKTATPSSRSVEIFEGIEGMRWVFDEIRKVKNLRVLNATGLIFDYLKYSAGHIVKDIEIGRGCQVIATKSVRKTPLGKSKKIKFRYLPKKADNYATTFIYGNTVVIQVLKDKPFLIKIENKEIADGYRKDFNVLWELL
jgi:sugar-specific transcriptional regulator TrmB